ncbi:uncharacterized protein EURHEDRAFT_381475 [Aspergillus ruber CBS 135680]|uniref:Uncharacterized protein n=1 Tax=Aspergillus ruber (strain CBS 135680) TaxID=1388766 RepID=A0A017S2D2_ASPRC|nr:uncharacterized protein EURHEDRAFT_381475 [Aspergillus ruber CBS 135680]EYE90986.1 hypothetical protein EURHEDRAFT_381475 [Aspergillus ruber CBS 135680]
MKARMMSITFITASSMILPRSGKCQSSAIVRTQVNFEGIHQTYRLTKLTSAAATSLTICASYEDEFDIASNSNFS